MQMYSKDEKICLPAAKYILPHNCALTLHLEPLNTNVLKGEDGTLLSTQNLSIWVWAHRETFFYHFLTQT